MTGLLAVLDCMLDVDPRDLVDSQLAAALIEFEQSARRIDAARARVLAEFDARRAHATRGSANAAAWLRANCGMSAGSASAAVRLARGLRALPLTGAALAAGRVSAAHAHAIIGLRSDIPLADIQATEAEFITLAEGWDPGRLHRYAQSIRHSYRPESVVGEESRQRDQRDLRLASSLGGMVFMRGSAHPEGGALIDAALSALAAKTGPADLRSRGQRYYDALETLCRAFLDSGKLPACGGVKAHLTVVVDLPALLGAPGARMADLGYAGQISGEAARRLSCDAAVSRVITDGPSHILDAGRTVRTVTPAQRRALVVRDRGCVFPGCGAAPDRCEAHHLIHWARNGNTNLAAMGLACGFHHWLVHEGGWTLTRNSEGGWTATPP